MIKAYFFDWFGTLAYFGSLEHYNNRESEKDAVDLLSDEEKRSLLSKSFDEAEIPEESRDDVRSVLENVEVNLYSDSEETICNLKLNYKLALVSNMYALTNHRIRKLFPLFLNNFNCLVLSTEVGLIKPDPKLYSYACKSLGVDPSDVVMVGDNQEYDIEPALKLGMQAKHIDRECQCLEDVL